MSKFVHYDVAGRHKLTVEFSEAPLRVYIDAQVDDDDYDRSLYVFYWSTYGYWYNSQYDAPAGLIDIVNEDWEKHLHSLMLEDEHEPLHSL
jgi:hypothetical protein